MTSYGISLQSKNNMFVSFNFYCKILETEFVLFIVQKLSSLIDKLRKN